MDRAVERLERMAADLGALSHTEGNAHADLEPEPLAVHGVLLAATEGTRPDFARAGLDLVLEAATPDLMVRADRLRLGEILENLLANSASHTAAGRRVVLGTRPRGSRVEFYVLDEGCGIRQEDLPLMFEPFFRGNGGSAGHTARPGMGLGLAIARRLAEAMDGSLALESPGPGLGALAKLSLPQA